MSVFKYTKVRDVKSPTRGTPGSAGIDFYLPENIAEAAVGNNCYIIGDNAILIGQGGDILIPSGLHVAMTEGYCMTLKFEKSGVVTKKKLIHGANLVDEDYQGEFRFHLINAGIEMQMVMGGEKIAQGIIMASNAHWPIQEVPDLEALYGRIETARGSKGFGSTGTN